MNKNLNTTKLGLQDLYHEMLKKNTTFGKTMSKVEKDGELYSGHVSYVCSAIVIKFYVEAGLFDNLSI